MKKMSRVLLAVLLVAVSVGCFGCGVKESGFYTYKVLQREVRITGLTESGKQQKHLIIPKELGGYPVTKMGEDSMWAHVSYFESEILEKVYINFELTLSNGTIYKCIKLSSLFMLGNMDCRSLSMSTGSRIKVYSSPYRVPMSTEFVPSNIQFLYNFKDAEEGGYYWVDKLEEGETLEVIPTDPFRDGYTFEGWYKEAECINKWNFETATKQKEDMMLYAKWTKK